MKLSISIGAFAVLICALYAVSCGPNNTESEPEIELIFASQSVLDCNSSDGAYIPDDIERLVVQIEDPNKVNDRWTDLKTIEGIGRGEQILLSSIPEGPQVLRFVACKGMAAEWVGMSSLEITAGQKHRVTVRMNAVNAVTCNAAGRTDGYRELAFPSPTSLFATHASLSDGRTIIVSGAEGIADNNLTAETSTWQIFEPMEAVFMPGVERASPLADRQTVLPRIGAAAIEIPRAFGLGNAVLLVGGAAAVERGAFEDGPFRPSRCSDATISAEVLQLNDGRFVPLQTEPSLTQRFLPGIAASDNAILIAGGIDCAQDPPAGSSTADLLTPQGNEKIELGVRMVGPSVTALSDGRFLVWGHDLNGSAQSGVLITTDEARSVIPLGVSGDPICAEGLSTPCWHSTAYHTATQLKGNASSSDRIVVFGGLRASDDSKLINNPSFGVEKSPNFFRLEVNGNSAQIDAFGSPQENQANRRAFHQAVQLDDSILVSGGWIYDGNALALSAAETILRIDEEGQLTTIAAGSAARLGHSAFAGQPGQVVMVGGMSPDPDQPGEFELHGTADIFTSVLAIDPCLLEE